MTIFRMQELAWLIVNNVDLESAQRNQFFRIPYIDLGPIITSEAVKKVGTKSIQF